MQYEVVYKFRKDNGLAYSMPTDSATVKIVAESVQEARLKAIDHAYATHDPCSHVQIVHVKQIDC